MPATTKADAATQPIVKINQLFEDAMPSETIAEVVTLADVKSMARHGRYQILLLKDRTFIGFSGGVARHDRSALDGLGFHPVLPLVQAARHLKIHPLVEFVHQLPAAQLKSALDRLNLTELLQLQILTFAIL